MSAQPRKPAPRIARPAQRYWKGKAPKGVEQKDSSDEEDEDEPQPQEDNQQEDMPLGVVNDEVKRSKGAMNVTLKDVNVDARGKVIVGGRVESGRTTMEESEEESESDDEEKPPKPAAEESGSSEYESSSGEEEEEEEEKPKPMFRPVFVPKRGRATVLEREQENPESEEAIAKKEKELEQRKKESHDLVAESIKRELAEKETEAVIPDVDDTDGLDPEAEFEAWRLRELSRIKRDKEFKLEREREKEEVERRRAMPEAQRIAEDLEHAKKSRDEKPKGQQKFLQKYWHKGAFHQDDEILKKHDFTEATKSTVDVSLLPKVMQVRDFGKRSRTKYTHLVDQDTTRAASLGAGTTNPSGSGCFLCGGSHMKKDCPQNPANGGTRGANVTGANQASGSNGTRKWGVGSRQAAAIAEERNRKSSWRDREENSHVAPPQDRQRDERGDRHRLPPRAPRDDREKSRKYDEYDRDRRRRDEDHDRMLRRSRSASREREGDAEKRRRYR